MKVIEILSKIAQIDQLIRLESTGNPTQLAQRVNLSERQLRRYIQTMTDLGAEIRYDKDRVSYRYEKPLKFNYGFKELL